MFLFHEEMWPPPAEGAQLVYPILRNSSEVILGGAEENVLGPSRSRNVDGDEAMVGRGVTERAVGMQGMERRDRVGITQTMLVGQPVALINAWSPPVLQYSLLH